MGVSAVSPVLKYRFFILFSPFLYGVIFAVTFFDYQDFIDNLKLVVSPGSHIWPL